MCTSLGQSTEKQSNRENMSLKIAAQGDSEDSQTRNCVTPERVPSSAEEGRKPLGGRLT